MKPLRSSTVLLKRLDRIQDRLQSLRLHTTDGQCSPEQRAEAVIILNAYKASTVEIVHAMLGEVAVCDDPGIKHTFQHYIDHNNPKRIDSPYHMLSACARSELSEAPLTDEVDPFTKE
jgi:hypothetical protein